MRETLIEVFMAGQSHQVTHLKVNNIRNTLHTISED